MTELATRDDDATLLQQFKTENPLTSRVNMFVDIWRRLRLTWRLVGDPRVKLLPKMIPVGILLYILSPIDILPALVTGVFGLIDDVVLLTFGLDMFFRFVPDDVLLEHARDLGYE